MGRALPGNGVHVNPRSGSRERPEMARRDVNVNVRETRDGQNDAATGALRHRPSRICVLTPMIAPIAYTQ